MSSIARHPRQFYVALAALIAVIAFVGFWPSYFGPLFAGTVDRIPVIHFHATVFVGWLVLFATQTVLAATGRTAMHVKLGQIGIGYGIFLILVGLLVSFTMFAVRVRAGDVEQAQLSLLGPLVDMIVFAPLFGAAIYFRRKREIHKRLMIVATTSLLIAAVARMPFFGTPPNVWLLQAVWFAPIFLAAGYDFVRRRIVHPIYVLGVVLLWAEATWRRGARESETWQDVCTWLAGFFV